MNQPVKTLPKPKPNLIPKDINKNNNAKNEKHKKKRTVKHLDQLFTKEFKF